MTIQIVSAKNPQWADTAHTAINLDVDFGHLEELSVPFTASQTDTEAHGIALFTRAAAGEFGVIAEAPVPPVAIPAEISSLQFFVAAAQAGFITQVEALAASRSGAVPAAFAALFARLPKDRAFVAEVRWAAMTRVTRDDPLVAQAASDLGLTSDQLDAFFITAATI